MMSISLLSGLWGVSVLMASTIYQIGVKRWANKKAEQVRQAGGPDEVKKNVEIGQQTSSKLALATRLAVGALAISYSPNMPNLIFPLFNHFQIRKAEIAWLPCYTGV